MNVFDLLYKCFDTTRQKIKVDAELSGSILAVAQIGTDQEVAFANSAPQDTQVAVDITKPDNPSQRNQVSVYNPSTVTDLTIKLFAKELTFGGGTQYTFIDFITVPKSQTITGTTINAYIKEFESLFAGVDLRLVISNDTVLGVADAFSAYVRVKAV